jgi:hypothetical protein
VFKSVHFYCFESDWFCHSRDDLEHH